jgi:hypothetical protein
MAQRAESKKLLRVALVSRLVFIYNVGSKYWFVPKYWFLPIPWKIRKLTHFMQLECKISNRYGFVMRTDKRLREKLRKAK